MFLNVLAAGSMSLPFDRNLGENRTDALFHAQLRRIDNDPFAVPRSVIPLNNLLPGGQYVTSNVRRAPFHAAPMFMHISADDLDVDRRDTASFGNGSPFTAGEGPWVNRVGDDDASKTEVVLSDCVRDAVSLGFYRPSGPPQGLFDRVDTQIDGG